MGVHPCLARARRCWHPHMMIFAPNYKNEMVGGNAFGSPLPQVSDDAGTPLSVVVVPVDDKPAVKAQSPNSTARAAMVGTMEH